MGASAAMWCYRTARRAADSDTDGSLLHELVHAMRFISGVFRYSGADEGYDNNEEFYANTIEMIYRSEKRLPIYDYRNHPIVAASFFDRKTLARFLLAELRAQQQSLFLELAKVDTAFNPVRQIESERQKLIDDYNAAHPQ